MILVVEDSWDFCAEQESHHLNVVAAAAAAAGEAFGAVLDE